MFHPPFELIISQVSSISDHGRYSLTIFSIPGHVSQTGALVHRFSAFFSRRKSCFTVPRLQLKRLGATAFDIPISMESSLDRSCLIPRLSMRQSPPNPAPVRAILRALSAIREATQSFQFSLSAYFTCRSRYSSSPPFPSRPCQVSDACTFLNFHRKHFFPLPRIDCGPLRFLHQGCDPVFWSLRNSTGVVVGPPSVAFNVPLASPPADCLRLNAGGPDVFR